MTSNISAIAESISANHTVSNKKIQLNPNVQLSCPFPVSEKSKDLSEIYLTPAVNKIERKPITAQYPDDYNIIGIDSTSFTLGTIEDGVVGSIRLSVVSTERNSNKQSLHSYGPYNFPISSDTKQKIFDHLYKQVYNLDPDKKRNSPDAAKMLERIRAVLERYIQMETIGKNSSSIILLDGSFIGGTQDTPMEFMKNLVTCQNDNIPVAIAKETNLTLENGKNILSLLDKAYY